jgi:Xaa-Pro aminopeptidase
MERHDLDVLLIYSTPGCMRYGQRGHVLYVSGYEPYFGDAMAILPADDETDPLLQIDQADFLPSEHVWIKDTIPWKDPVLTVTNYLKDNRIARARMGIAGEYSMPPPLINRLKKKFRDPPITFASEILEKERIVKSEFEIASIGKASEIAGIGFEAAAEYAKPGVTEADVAAEVERVCRTAGSEYFPHHTMVSSGTSAKHLDLWWYCGRRRLRRNDPWNLDFGTMYNAYCCDIARSYCLGAPSSKHRRIYEVLVEAEEAACKAAKPGVMASEVNEVVIGIMNESFEGDFSGIGHGVGLEVHEWPFVGYQYILNDSVYRDRKLEKNTVISVEPQAYTKEFGYMQIEDEMVITQSGGKFLNQIPRELLG